MQREHRAHAPRARERALQLAGGMCDRRERTVDRADVLDDEVEPADGQPAVHHVQAADDQHERRAENRNDRHDDGEHRLLPCKRNARVHRLVASGGVAQGLVRLACEALHKTDGAERLIQALDELGLELLHALFAIHHRRRVVAQAQEQERDDGQREQRDRDIHPEEHDEHHDERDDRRGEREHAADDEVLDRVRVDVHAVDRIARARRDVVVQAERLQVLEQSVTQVVHHALTRVHLHLRAVRRHELVRGLQQHARDDEHDQQNEPAAAGHRHQPMPERLWERVLRVIEHVVDRDRQRPWLQRAKADLQQKEERQQRDLAAVRTQKAERPEQQWLLAIAGHRIAHAPIRPPVAPARSAAAAPGSARSSE